MSVHNCWKCQDAGEDCGGFCTCRHGRKLAQQERAPLFPSSVLVDAADNAHAERMAAENKKQCWSCDEWKPAGEWARMCIECLDKN